jgi:multidrug efflux pump subunit AcrA (membrane-fusion protein)
MGHPRSNRNRLVWALGLTTTCALGIGGLALTGVLPPRTAGSALLVSDETAAPSAPPAVKTIRPKQDTSLQVAVHNLATVEPYFQANLRTRVSGIVHAVYKDIGDRVEKGELLIDIDVPDLEYEVAQKDGVIHQREKELLVAEGKELLAEAERDVAKASVKMMQAKVPEALGIQEARGKQLARVQEMRKRDAVQPERVEEVEQEYKSAQSTVQAALAAVEKAQADAKEKEAGVIAAKSDVALKRTMIDVARKDYERSRALASYAQIKAPFDGAVIGRNVDPGSFIQNATTGQSEVLISVARTDLLTVSAKFPDNAAPFISTDTTALIELDDYPDAAISAHVTRFSPSIRNTDRTTTVEVDLFNGSPAEYERLIRRTICHGLAALSSAHPLGVAAADHCCQEFLWGQRKGANDGLPLLAVDAKLGKTARRLLPGMTGTMRLQLSRYTNSFVIPSSAIYTRGGKPYLLLIKGDVTKQAPVHVHVNDGNLAKVSLIVRVGDGRGGHREVLRELTGEEEIVASRQLEIGDGQTVTPTPSDW